MKTMAKVKNLGLLLVAALMMSGCGNSGGSSSGSGSGVVPFGLGNCVACTGLANGVAIANLSSGYQNLMQFSFQLIGDATAFQMSGGSPSLYQGPAALTGTMIVPSGFSLLANCPPVIPGQYTVYPQSQGQMSGGQLGSMQMVAQGPANLTMVFQNTILWSGNTRVSSQMYITSVNGISCQGDPGFVLN